MGETSAADSTLPARRFEKTLETPMSPSFSIIVPVYNVAPYLRACLDSVFMQSFADWECITVDDGSSDGSESILDEYAAKDPRFRVIHQPNGGEGAARNTGLDVARGEWIVFLDGDDILSSNALRWIDEAVAPDDEIVRFGFSTFQDAEPASFGSADIGKPRNVDISRQIDMSEFFAYVWQHAYRRKAIAGMQFKRYKRGCDRVFFDDVLLNRVSSIRILDASLYGYRRRPGSAMNAQPSMQVLLDEMDHRLDIIQMIEAGPKRVVYAGNNWLERYFTETLPAIMARTEDSVDRKRLADAWRNRLVQLRSARGLSSFGRFVAHVLSRCNSTLLANLLCRWIPRLRRGVRWRLERIRSVFFPSK